MPLSVQPASSSEVVYVYVGNPWQWRYQTHPSDKRLERELQSPGHKHTHAHAQTRLAHILLSISTCTPNNTDAAGLQVSREKLLAVQKQLKTWLLLSSMMDEVEVC